MPQTREAEAPKGVDERTMTTRTKAKTGVVNVPDSAKGGSCSLDDVRVGDIVLKLGERQEPVARTEAQQQGDGPKSRIFITSDDVVKEKECRVLVRNYRTKSDDVKWAQNGI
ncbi:hypothetical protein A2U01_0021012, partial [Trifolium medium]|nr:hypothetical protein [Trifolium medium]